MVQNKTECPVCSAEIILAEGSEQGELLTCPECGSELEIKSTLPPRLAEAPMEEEDWGQ